MIKVTTVKDIQRMREAFRTTYSKFAKDFDELGKKFRQISVDADLMLAAAEEIIKV